MPLYKITERRLKRKERDEEDGLAGLKAALREELGGGGDETDDEESESDTDSEDDGESDESSEDEVEDEAGEAGPSGTEDSDPDDEEEDEGRTSDLQPIDLDDESDEDEEEDLGPAPMSIAEAIKSPIYPGTKRRTKRQGKCSRCVLCPEKTLQGEKIVEEHLASSMHKRAVKRYQTRLDSSDPITTEDPRELVADIFDKLENEKKRGQKSSKANKAESSGTTTSGTPKPKSAKPPTSEPKSDAPSQPKIKKSKAERKASRAQKLLQSVGEKAVEVDGDEGEVKLNRQARRLLAQQGKGSDGKAASESKADTAEGEKKEKKNKKSRKARKSLLEEKGVEPAEEKEVQGEKGVETVDEKEVQGVKTDDKAERKEKRQKKTKV